jgi:hypothetical protein
VGLNQGLIECDKTVTSIQILIFNITFESDLFPIFLKLAGIRHPIQGFQ